MRVFDLAVRDEPGSLYDVRRALTRLADGAADTRALDAALVVVSELVTNANRYGGDGRCRLRVALQDGRFRIEVIDSSPLRPGAPSSVSPDSEGGRGLLLVAALARRWGSGPHRLGKCVWAEVPLQDVRRRAF